MNTEQNHHTQENDIAKNKDTAAAAYFMIIAPLLLYTRKDSQFIQHHAKQALALLGGFVLFWILGEILSFFSWLLIPILGMCTWGFINALSGRWYKIPGVYNLAQNGVSGSAIKKGLFRSKDFMINTTKGIISSASSQNYVPLEKRIQELEIICNQSSTIPSFKKIGDYSHNDTEAIKHYIDENKASSTPLSSIHIVSIEGETQYIGIGSDGLVKQL